MNTKPLTLFRLSIRNLKYNVIRSFGLVFIITVLSFSLFGNTVLSESLTNGLNSLSDRLGADIAIVPKEHTTDYKDALLTGEPSRFYFDKSIGEQIAKTEGVKRSTNQFFIATLSSDCCSQPIQIIGYEPETDFIIQPWISKVYNDTIKDGELVVGSEIVVDSSETLKFFDETFRVAAHLEATSTGMDVSVYANMNTIRKLVSAAHNVGMNLSMDLYKADINRSVSAVLLEVQEGYTVESVISNLRASFPDMGIIKSKSIFSDFSANLNVLLSVVDTITLILWVISILVLGVLFTVIINGRKKEYALLRTMGATRKKMMFSVLLESGIISILGGIFGTGLALLVLLPFGTFIGQKLSLPYILPNTGVLLLLMGLNLLLSFLVGPIASAYAAFKIGRKDAYTSIREGE